MCRLCTYVRWVFVSNKHTHFRTPALCSTGTAHTSQEHWQTGGPRLKIQQELTQQLSCLWFQRFVHLWSKLKFWVHTYFLKIKFTFKNEAFPEFHYQQLKKSTATNYFVTLSLLIPAEVIYSFFSEGKHQAYSGSICTLKPEYCSSTIYITYVVHMTYTLLTHWWCM